MTRFADFLIRLAGDHLVDDDDRRLADALTTRLVTGGEDAVRAALDLARLIGEAAEPRSVLAAIDRAIDDDVATNVMTMVVAAFATVRATYEARQDATTARAALAARAEALYPTIAPVGADVLDFVIRLVGSACLHLSIVAASRVPVVRVETGISLPSTLLAYDLYGDAQRAGDIVGRNKVATPLIMPSVFEAVAA
ncbi:hypothetical protein [Mesorhizobium sp. CAU 1732]|uniref:hypothetical protein n=1 Tax=Mesorhizobium sp. CAU 1732 TaxID=3140358 RepID=UPI003261B0E2